MSKTDETFDNALEREARGAKADIDRLIQELAALPAEVATDIRVRIDSERSRLVVIAGRAERALEDRHADLTERLALLERQLEGQTDELKRTRIEASKAEAEEAYEASRYALENARAYAKDGIEFSAEALGRNSRAL